MYYRTNNNYPAEPLYPHSPYPRNEAFQGYQQSMNPPYPFQQQEMNHQAMQQPYQVSQPPFQQNAMPNMMDSSFSNDNGNQTPFDYFQKPEQPMNWPNSASFDPSQFQQNPQVPPSIVSQFQKENGQLDLDKVLGTVGQLANTYHQVAPIFQQFSSFMKNFRAGS